jgi:DNA-3-methyladenine glycosylase
LKIKHNLFDSAFFDQPSLEIAPKILGAKLCHRAENGMIQKFTICETEAYHGTDDLASHASRGKNQKNQLMFGPSNIWYLYLCYGVHWMLNLVTDIEGAPSAVFIRATLEVTGPGRLTRSLSLDQSYSGIPNDPSTNLWLEKSSSKPETIKRGPRVGISGAGPYWSKVPYRFWFSNSTQVE